MSVVFRPRKSERDVAFARCGYTLTPACNKIKDPPVNLCSEYRCSTESCVVLEPPLSTDICLVNIIEPEGERHEEEGDRNGVHRLNVIVHLHVVHHRPVHQRRALRNHRQHVEEYLQGFVSLLLGTTDEL